MIKNPNGRAAKIHLAGSSQNGTTQLRSVEGENALLTARNPVSASLMYSGTEAGEQAVSG